LGSVFWTSKKWNSRCARMGWKNRSIDERETYTTSLDTNGEDNKQEIRFVALSTWKAWWYCFVAYQALLLPSRPFAMAPSTFLSTATKRYQSAALLHPAIAAFVHPCTSMPPRFPAGSCASRPSRGSADTSLRDGRRRPSMACPCGLVPAEPAMLGRAKGISVVTMRRVWWEVTWKSNARNCSDCPRFASNQGGSADDSMDEGGRATQDAKAEFTSVNEHFQRRVGANKGVS